MDKHQIDEFLYEQKEQTDMLTAIARELRRSNELKMKELELKEVNYGNKISEKKS